jgi:hypothetical protein
MTIDIHDTDIKYSDDKVTILYPHVKKGMLIVTFFEPPDSGENLRETGLKTGKRLQEEGIDFGRSKIHPYIFFRAPIYVDYKESGINTPKDELIKNYGELFEKYAYMFPNVIAIRVDPDKTMVYPSEMRTQGFGNKKFETEFKKSEKTMTEYLKIVKENSLTKNSYIEHNIYYNLLSGEKRVVDKKWTMPYPFNTTPIERNSEVLVQIPHLTHDYFAKID